ncbi:unnamed protein product [Agarophyton chilense]
MDAPPGSHYAIQVAGHQLIRQSPTPGRILKPWSPKEHAFYRTIHAPHFPPHLHWLRAVTPMFHGVHCTPSTTSTTAARWLQLEDLNSPFVKPCVMDVKIGFRHYDDDASQRKRVSQILSANATTTATCAVRFVGTRSFKRTTSPTCDRGRFETRDKAYGRALEQNHLLPELIWFFSDNFCFDALSAQHTLNALRHICQNFRAQKRFFFYSSSLLVIYEGAKSAQHYPRVDVRMIDFSHTVHSNGAPDIGYLHGLEYMLHLLSEALRFQARPHSVESHP